LGDFDQSFYVTIAYDIVHHGVFSNGKFDKVENAHTVPPPGRFFGPVYPTLVAAAMKIDSRFARTVDCKVSKPITKAEPDPITRPRITRPAKSMCFRSISCMLCCSLLACSQSLWPPR